MKTLFVAMMLCLNIPVFGEAVGVTPTEITASEIANAAWINESDTMETHSTTWAFRPSYVLERVVIDTVAKCDTVFVPESVMGTLDDWETVTYCRVEIHCKKVARERVLWSVTVDGNIDISGLPGLRVREVPNAWLLMGEASDTLQIQDFEAKR